MNLYTVQSMEASAETPLVHGFQNIHHASSAVTRIASGSEGKMDRLMAANDDCEQPRDTNVDQAWIMLSGLTFLAANAELHS
jgi:hypothetical protein